MASEKNCRKNFRPKSYGILCDRCATNKILIETFMVIEYIYICIYIELGVLIKQHLTHQMGFSKWHRGGKAVMAKFFFFFFFFFFALLGHREKDKIAGNTSIAGTLTGLWLGAHARISRGSSHVD